MAVLSLGLACLLLLALPIGAARAETPPWQWPFPPPHQVVAPFDAPADRYGPGHRGIDIAAPATGATVRAVAPGTVRFSGMVAGRGVVSVAHASGLISTYEPVTGTVSAGDQVQAGKELGTLVSESELSHCAGTACLHLGARRGEDYVDPLLLLGGRGPSVLLPWTGGSGGLGDASRVADSRGAAPAPRSQENPDGGSSPQPPAPGTRARADEPSKRAERSSIAPSVFTGGDRYGDRPGLRQASLA